MLCGLCGNHEGDYPDKENFMICRACHDKKELDELRLL